MNNERGGFANASSNGRTARSFGGLRMTVKGVVFQSPHQMAKQPDPSEASG
jgi:hypothetical protein